MSVGQLAEVSVFFIIFAPLFASILGLFVIFYLAKYRVLNASKGDEKMIAIADSIKVGAKAFLQKEYMYLALFVIIMFFIIGAVTGEWIQYGVSFLLGAFLSAFCGYAGMLIAVEANVRTAEAAKTGLNDALRVAFASGGVMGLAVVCVGSLGLILLYSIWPFWTQTETNYLAGFGFGASSIALFARVGGGIYTKAADVGADLVGKVNASIPEDDPRNPATIADNVGDNVGDVAGMGADLFESFVGSIVATIQLSQITAMEHNGFTSLTKVEDLSSAEEAIVSLDAFHFIALPFLIAGFGIVASIIGIFLVRTNKTPANDQLQEVLLATLRRGVFTATFLSWIASAISIGVLFGFFGDIFWRILICTSIGLVGGELIGFFTEYTTSPAYKPTRSIAKKARIGSAGVVIQGLGIGMLSTMAPVLVIFGAILGCFELFDVYGIAIAAVGMLSTLGVTLATDAFGPVSDNAGGIAEMAELDEEVRDRTDGLDALGNTTAATGKGFAIGSAVLTSLALLNAFKEEAELSTIDVSKSSVLAAAIFGACLPYIFGALTMMAVGRAAALIISEVLRQFDEYQLLSDKPLREPDYQKCVAISTQASIVEMVIPGVLAVCGPLFIGFLLGTEALGGMLIGGITSGFMLAVFMSNAGGAWDNAKKFVEAKGLGPDKAKGSDYHKAVVVGDTIGDPFKDTSGPSLNILIKMMTMIALVFGGGFNNEEYSNTWWIGVVVAIIFIAISISLVMWMRSTGYGKLPPVDGANTQDLSKANGIAVKSKSELQRVQTTEANDEADEQEEEDTNTNTNVISNDNDTDEAGGRTEDADNANDSQKLIDTDE